MSDGAALLRHPLRRREFRPQQLRGLRDGVHGRAGVFGRAVPVPERHHTLRRALRGHLDGQQQLRGLRQRLPRGHHVCERWLRLPRRHHLLRNDVHQHDDRPQQLRHVQQPLPERHHLFGWALRVSRGPDVVRKHLRQHEQQQQSLWRMQPGLCLAADLRVGHLHVHPHLRVGTIAEHRGLWDGHRPSLRDRELWLRHDVSHRSGVRCHHAYLSLCAQLSCGHHVWRLGRLRRFLPRHLSRGVDLQRGAHVEPATVPMCPRFLSGGV